MLENKYNDILDLLSLVHFNYRKFIISKYKFIDKSENEIIDYLINFKNLNNFQAKLIFVALKNYSNSINNKNLSYNDNSNGVEKYSIKISGFLLNILSSIIINSSIFGVSSYILKKPISDETIVIYIITEVFKIFKDCYNKFFYDRNDSQCHKCIKNISDYIYNVLKNTGLIDLLKKDLK